MFIKPIWDGRTCHLIGTLIGAGAGLAGSLIASQSRRDAAEAARAAAQRAARRASRFQEDLLAIQRQLLEEGRELREARNLASIRATGRLEEFAERPPGTSRFVTEGIRRGGEEIASTLSAYGLDPDTSVFGESLGEVSGRLLTEEERLRTEVDRILASQGTDPSALGATFGGQALDAESLVQQALGAEASAGLSTSTIPGTGEIVLSNIQSLLQDNPELLGSLTSLFGSSGGEGAGKVALDNSLIGFESFFPGDIEGNFFRLPGEGGKQRQQALEALLKEEDAFDLMGFDRYL